jgi:predicted ATPase
MAANGKDRLRITRLRLERWRNFDAVDIPLQGRAFFVGPNASGKSNLLDAIRFLRDIAAVGGGLEAAVQRRGGMSRIVNLAASPGQDLAIGVDLATPGSTARWRYDLRIGLAEDGLRPALLAETVREDGRPLLDRPNVEDRTDPQRRHQTHLEQVASNQQFRALADFFASVSYVHVVPEFVRGRGRSDGDHLDVLGEDLVERLAAGDPSARERRLSRIVDGLRPAIPQLASLGLTRDRRGAWRLEGRFEHWRSGAGTQSEETFSDGTLRLLGMLWAMLEEGGPLLLEEPELSLHAEVIRHLPAMFAGLQRSKGRQVFLSTHSEALLADPGIGLDEVFLLVPDREGTRVESVVDRDDIRRLLDGGFTMGEAVLPMMSARPHRLGLFGA